MGAAPDPLTVHTVDLVFGTRTISGSLTGTSVENEDNLAFSARQNIRPMTEVLRLAEAPRAYERMLSGQARFRVALEVAA